MGKVASLATFADPIGKATNIAPVVLFLSRGVFPAKKSMTDWFAIDVTFTSSLPICPQLLIFTRNTIAKMAINF